MLNELLYIYMRVCVGKKVNITSTLFEKNDVHFANIDHVSFGGAMALYGAILPYLRDIKFLDNTAFRAGAGIQLGY